MENRKAYSYIRFSSPEQARGGSKVRQTEKCLEYCLNNGLELALDDEYAFFDGGKSAYKGDHLSEKGDLRRFLNLVEDGTIERGSWLIVESLDRLSRESVPDALVRFIALLKQGIRIVTIKDGMVYDENFSDQQLIMSIFDMSRAHGESTLKSFRIGDKWKKKKVAARESLKPIGKGVPLWLELVDGKYEIKEERAEVIKQIFAVALEGYGRDSIAKKLNAQKILSFTGKSWGGRSVSNILESRSLIGEYQPHSNQGKVRIPSGEVIKGYFPSVIEEAVFYEAKAGIESRRVGKSTKQSSNFQVWQKIAKCTLCSANMHLVIKSQYRYLQCYQARKGVCAGKTVPLPKTEEVFREMLAKVDSLPLVQGSSKSISKKLNAIEGRLLEVNSKYESYKSALRGGEVSRGITELMLESEKEIDSLKAQKDELEEELKLETIVSKDHFFSKLDVTSYEGRFRANALLLRLKITVFMEVVDKSRTDFIIIQNGKPIFAFSNTKHDGLIFTPLNNDQIKKAQVLDYDGSDKSALLVFLSEVILNHATTADKSAEDIYKRLGINRELK